MSASLAADFEKRYPGGATVRASLTQRAGPAARVTALFGPSGSGKTTILRCLAGLERPQSGSIRFGSQVWFDAAQRIHLRPQARGIGFLFQDYALFPHLTVAQNIGYAVPRAGRGKRVGELLELLGIAGLERRYAHQISAGQQQRVALARALAPRPRMLLLDEPLAALDAPTRESLRRELRKVLVGLGMPAFVVTHDPIEAVSLADDAVVLADGRVRQHGPIDQVFSRPADPLVARIVGVETIAPGVVLEVSADGLATVRAGAVELTALSPSIRAGAAVYVCIRGEDVTLERGHPEQTSARNRLPARVTWIAPEGAIVRVGLDCGIALTALITRPAAEQLGLIEGILVDALVKAPAIHLVAR